MGRKLLILVPAFNEEFTIAQVIEELPGKIPKIDAIQIMVVNDGSTDKTAKKAHQTGALVITHLINRGLGAALATGFAYAKKKEFDFIITFDGDGQHQAKDIVRILKPLIEKKADVVIGTRLNREGDMPFPRKIINSFSNILTWALFGIWTTDSQSGLRGFNTFAIQNLQLKSERMEVSSEIFKEIRRLHLSKIEVPIASIYTHYSLQKGQRLTNAPAVVWKLMLQQFS